MTYQMYATTPLLTSSQCEGLISWANASPRWVDYTAEAVHENGIRQLTQDLDAKEHMELYQKVWSSMMKVNAKTWLFDIDKWQQPLRIAKYEVGYHHDWHLDYTDDDESKLAMSVPLNAEYEGGELQLLEVPEVKQVSTGRAVFFPGYHGHRVTPITKGVRYVLLGWFTGPRFR